MWYSKWNMLPKVIKRDGVEESFSLINLANVATASGLTPDQAKALAETIKTWAESLNVEKITSLQIRDQMLIEIRKISQPAADLYTWYEQSKEL